MQRTLKLFVFILILLPISLFAASKPIGTLKVTINGFSNDQGVVRLALFNSEAAYVHDGNTGKDAYYKAAIPIHNGKASLNIPNIPYGEYAIKFFQDENNSGHLKTNMFGKPLAGYGFSNNPNASKGPASYDQAKFFFNKKEAHLNLTVNN